MYQLCSCIFTHILLIPILSFFLSFFALGHWEPSELGVGREVDRVLDPGGKEYGRCTEAGKKAGNVAINVKKATKIV